MKRIGTLVAALAFIAAYGCAAPADPVPTEGSAADEAAIEAGVQSYVAAYNAKDAAAVAAHQTEDYNTITAAGVHIQGRAGYQAHIEEVLAVLPEGVMLSLETGYIQWHSADLATVGGTYHLVGLPEGVSNSGSWMVSMVRSDTGWLARNGLVAAFQPPTDDSGGG
jgi:uncharacterized protein (TIGR02246 family)